MNILLNYLQVFRKSSPYSLYVLIVMLFTYILNQLDRYALSITTLNIAQELHYGDMACLKLANQTKQMSDVCAAAKNETICNQIFDNETHQRVCEYNYNGQGYEYQILAGPIFILVFTFTGILLSLFADQFQNRRVIILSACLVWWSAMTLLTGFAQSYWQLALLRFGLGIGQAGCNPLATSLIADYFNIELRGAALGIYNWGIYTGYSFSFSIGNQILKHLNWRWVFIICSLPGFAIGLLTVLTVRQPKSKSAQMEKKESDETDTEEKLPPVETNFMKLKLVIVEFLKPTLLMLCLAGSIRNAAGYVWAYTNNSYYKFLNQTPDQISSYLGVIPIVFGIIGSFVGGFVSDRVAKRAKPWMRIWVLVISQIMAAPFVAGVLFFDPPYSYYFLIPAYIFGEMWVGVLLSVIVELVPERLRTSGIGFYFFLISNVGGNMQVLVPPTQAWLKKTFNQTEIESFRDTLYIFYPGEYVLGSALFLLTLFVIKRDIQKVNERKQTEISESLINTRRIEGNKIDEIVSATSVAANNSKNECFDNPDFEAD